MVFAVFIAAYRYGCWDCSEQHRFDCGPTRQQKRNYGDDAAHGSTRQSIHRSSFLESYIQRSSVSTVLSGQSASSRLHYPIQILDHLSRQRLPGTYLTHRSERLGLPPPKKQKQWQLTETLSRFARLSLKRGVSFDAMRRLAANLVIAAILGTFALPLTIALQNSGIPACCRPGGKHHCSQTPSENSFKSKSDACPYAAQFLATRVLSRYSAKVDSSGLVFTGSLEITFVPSSYEFWRPQPSDRGPPLVSC